MQMIPLLAPTYQCDDYDYENSELPLALLAQNRKRDLGTTSGNQIKNKNKNKTKQNK